VARDPEPAVRRAEQAGGRRPDRGVRGRPARAQGEQARKYLTALRAHADSEHKRYEQIRDSYDWSRGDKAFFARAALENGLRSTRMESEWASWVLDELDKR
jgi:hypothetical protein